MNLLIAALAALVSTGPVAQQSAPRLELVGDVKKIWDEGRPTLTSAGTAGCAS
jgi:hypothetical protein